jgi:hypothetical protein
MIEIDHLFISPYELQFLFFFKFFSPIAYLNFFYRWSIILMDFVGFPFRTFKFKNDINNIKYKFSHRFGNVCR